MQAKNPVRRTRSFQLDFSKFKCRSTEGQYIKIRAHLIYITLHLGTPIDAKEQYGIYPVDEANKKTFDILDQCAWNWNSIL